MNTDTKMKHTATPWTIHWGMAQGGDGPWIMDAQDHGDLSRIAMVAFHDDTSGDETRANAKVIAAAPEMLASLIACVEWLGAIVPAEFLNEYDRHVLRTAAEVIEKATGGEWKGE